MEYIHFSSSLRMGPGSCTQIGNNAYNKFINFPLSTHIFLLPNGPRQLYSYRAIGWAKEHLRHKFIDICTVKNRRTSLSSLVRDADQSMSVMEKLSDICDDPTHQNHSHLQVFSNWQGFESSQGQKNLKIFWLKACLLIFSTFLLSYC